jgi:hypothetical protein
MENLSHNLNIFRILFLIKGILTLLLAVFFILYALLGGYILNVAASSSDLRHLPFNPGIIFYIIGCVGFVFTATLGILTLLASKYLKEIRKHNFIFVVAILNCLTGVLGILLGVFTMIELNKPAVRAMFESNKRE